MEHSFDLVSPWRARAFLAAAIAALELLVILVAGIVLIAKPLSRHMRSAAATRKAPPATHTRAKHAKTPPHAMLSRGQTSVLVLNGNGRQGAAGAEAAQVRNLGYPVKGVGNAARMNYGRTVVMYRPGYAAEARRFARESGIRLVSPLDGLGVRALKGARIAVVLGSSS